MPTATELIKRVEKLPKDQYEILAKFIMIFTKDQDADFNEDIIKETGLSENRKEFLKSAGKIDIDEEAVLKYRMRDMI